MPRLEPWIADFRNALRSLARNRGFTATALIIFALCLGANVALFAIVNAVLLRPLPFLQAKQLVTVYNSYPKAGVVRAGSSVPCYFERKTGIAAFADAGAYRDTDRTLSESNTPERISGMSATPSFFRLLGASAALGRTFSEQEGEVGNDQVVILSDGLWREKFGADPQIVGKTLRFDGSGPLTIIGVMPKDFRYLSSRARLWIPLTFNAESRKPEERHSNNIIVIARLKPGLTAAVAQTQVDALNQSMLATDPYAKLVTDAGFTTKVVDLQEDHIAATRPIVLLLQAAVLLLLVIGLVNLANLLLVRATGRSKEMSVRQALGATSAQLGRQIILETTVLAVVGGALGLLSGWGALRIATSVGLDQLPHSGDLGIDLIVGLLTLAGSLLVGVLLALPLLWHARQRNLGAALAAESRGGTTSRSTNRLRHGLIAAQIALAFVLLADAGLLGLSFAQVLAVKPGFQPESILTATVPLPHKRYPENKDRIAFTERLQRELSSAPGIASVGLGSMLPFAERGDENAVTVEGYTPAPGDSIQAHYMGGVTGNYFATLGIPLREGRYLTADDTAHGTKVCVIDEVVARRYWPKGGALGGRIYRGVKKDGEEPSTVVGVVGSVKQTDLAEQRAIGTLYLPYSDFTAHNIVVAIRTTQTPESVVATLRHTLRQIDPNLPLVDPKPLATRIAESLESRRSPLLLAGVFASVAIALVAVGLYGVLAYTVSQRRREIGVRMALGAAPNDIRGQFLGLGIRLVVVGILVGGVGAWCSGHVMQSLLFGVGAQQVFVFAGAVAMLTVVALAAASLPAIRAARVPPMEALRTD